MYPITHALPPEPHHCVQLGSPGSETQKLHNFMLTNFIPKSMEPDVFQDAEHDKSVYFLRKVKDLSEKLTFFTNSHCNMFESTDNVIFCTYVQNGTGRSLLNYQSQVQDSLT